MVYKCINFCNMNFTYILWLLVVLYALGIILSPIVNPIVFGTFTYWSLVLQALFYANELTEDENRRRIILNLATAPSVSVLSYWGLVNAYNWPFQVPWFIDICIHLLNILLLLGIVIIWYPLIEYKYIWIPITFGVLYLIGCFVYTGYTNELIYPTDVFSFDGYWWVSLVLFFITVLNHLSLSYLCKWLRERQGFQQI